MATNHTDGVIIHARRTVYHTRRTVVIRTTLLTTERLFCHCQTKNWRLDADSAVPHSQNLPFSVARGTAGDRAGRGAHAHAYHAKARPVRPQVQRVSQESVMVPLRGFPPLAGAPAMSGNAVRLLARAGGQGGGGSTLVGTMYGRLRNASRGCHPYEGKGAPPWPGELPREGVEPQQAHPEKAAVVACP